MVLEAVDQIVDQINDWLSIGRRIRVSTIGTGFSLTRYYTQTYEIPRSATLLLLLLR